jgi:hypothetical protein
VSTIQQRLRDLNGWFDEVVVLEAADALDARDARIEELEAERDVWMNGVADIVEALGFDREAACGPSDLLPGLRFLVERHGEATFDLSRRTAALRYLYESAIEWPGLGDEWFDALSGARAALGVKGQTGLSRVAVLDAALRKACNDGWSDGDSAYEWYVYAARVALGDDQ